MADGELSQETVRITLAVMNELFDEAFENGYITKSPARKVTVPRCKPPKETRPLDEAEVRRIFETTFGLLGLAHTVPHGLPYRGVVGLDQGRSATGRATD